MTVCSQSNVKKTSSSVMAVRTLLTALAFLPLSYLTVSPSALISLHSSDT